MKKAIGLRELKNRLSEVVREVRATGEEYLVTDRGTVVAEIRRPGVTADLDPNPKLAELVRSGRLRPALKPNEASAYPTFRRPLPAGEALRLLLEDRARR